MNNKIKMIFYKYLKQEVNISNTQRNEIEEKLKNNLKLVNDNYNYKFRTVNQGSFQCDTVIKDKDGKVDVDVAIIVECDVNSEHDVKDDLYNLLKSKSRGNVIKRKKCITVDYKNETNIDFPVIIEKNDKFYIVEKIHENDTLDMTLITDPKILTTELSNLDDNVKDIIKIVKSNKKNRVCINSVQLSVLMYNIFKNNHITLDIYDVVKIINDKLDNISESSFIELFMFKGENFASSDRAVNLNSLSTYFHKLQTMMTSEFEDALNQFEDFFDYRPNIDNDLEYSKSAHKIYFDNKIGCS